ncbi:MAG TPA: hypothetical protein VMI75_32180 [Polyangiaceae bacterium]|nr:hypothetical protein [Polyangiaceae bacterium]
MACKFICDGCGKEAPGYYSPAHNWHKPLHWFERADEDGPQTVCSRECIDKVAAKTGKTGVVLPL